MVHPQSVIHSMVEYVDGSVLAQLGTPDMRTPIATTLSWPDRMPSPSTKLDFGSLRDLSFETPDIERFPALRLARDAFRSQVARSPRRSMPLTKWPWLHFWPKILAFLDIAHICEKVVDTTQNQQGATNALETLEQVVAADGAARTLAREAIRAKSHKSL